MKNKKIYIESVKIYKKLIYEIIKNKKGNQIKFKEAKFDKEKLLKINIEDYKLN